MHCLAASIARTTAAHSSDAGQVNEMLTWLDHHPLTVVAATDRAHRLDPTALRRFVWKLELRPLGRVLTARAFERFFALPAPPALSELRTLTPGDFAVVARQLCHTGTVPADVLFDRLKLEAAHKPERGGTRGFG